MKILKKMLIAVLCIMVAICLLYGTAMLIHPNRGASYIGFYYSLKCLLFDAGNIVQGDNDVVFVGDSITAKCNLVKYYPDIATVNRGIEGDTAKGILQRMDCSIIELNPKIVVLHAGINDINIGYTNDEIIGNLCEIVEEIHEKLPKTKIIVQSIYPFGEDESLTVTERIISINAQLSTLSLEKDFAYVNLFDSLKAEDNRLDTAYSEDGIHPNDRGYSTIQPILYAAIKEALQ